MRGRTDEADSAGAFQEFFRTEAAAGALLVACACVALGAANSRWAEVYQRLWSTPVVIGAGGQLFTLTLRQWINDGLMSVFFLLVGLEIKREAVAGELASLRQAALPVAGAIGGMAVPAAIACIGFSLACCFSESTQFEALVLMKSETSDLMCCGETL